MSGGELARGAVVLAVVACFYAFFYTRVVARCGGIVRPLIRLLRLDSSSPARELDALGKLAAAAAAQAGFAVVLLGALGIDLPGVVAGPRPSQIALGAALGLAELGFSAFACTVALRAAVAIGGGRESDWRAPSRGGWMGQFLASARVAPAWLSTACVLLYVTGEEVVFRGALIEALRPAGAPAAIATSLVLFVGVQALHMPSGRSVLFPMVGAFVVGAVHGVLYWLTRDMVSLAVAHTTFFLGALAGLGGAPLVTSWRR